MANPPIKRYTTASSAPKREAARQDNIRALQEKGLLSGYQNTWHWDQDAQKFISIDAAKERKPTPGRCPTCGGPMNLNSPVTIDPMVGTVSANGSVANLTQTQIRLMAALISAYPKPATRQALVEHGWHGKTSPTPHSLSRHITELRDLIKPLKISISNIFGKGYWLENLSRNKGGNHAIE